MSRLAMIVMTGGLPLMLVTQAMGDEGMMNGSHRSLNTTVSKISAGFIFVATSEGLRPRAISPAKADRVGLHEARPGDGVVLIVDEGNVLIDAHKSGVPASGHRMVRGNLDYADTYWGEVKVSTPGGMERFDVDTLSGSKLSMMHEGAPVIVELDEDNTMIDIHRAH